MNADYSTRSFRNCLLLQASSRLKERVASPRPLQTLLSRYRCNRVESCGEYPRKLKFIADPSCRFCGDPQETLLHLFTDCAGTCAYRQEHDISLNTLVQEAPSSQLKLANFDAWIRKTVPYDSQPPGYRIQCTLNQLARDRKRRRSDESNRDGENHRPTKRNCLVIPDSSLEGTTQRVKIRRID